jgi:predicted DNA-binding protein YlxM (UPF0122 family)
MNPTKEQLEDLYCKQGLTQHEIAIKFETRQARISSLMQKYAIKTDKRWTDKEEEYLERYYGVLSLRAIANKIGKSPEAVESKARKSGMSCLMNSGKLNATELAKAFNVDGHVVIDNWIKKKGLKASFRVVKNTRKFWRIDIDEFWKWAYKNSSIINFAKLEKNILGAEPEWVELERRRDFKETAKRKFCKWTEEEDSKLKMLWSNTNYTAKEIGEVLGKSAAGVSRRKARLGLPPRKVPIKWKAGEIEILINMKLKGALDKEIAWELGREESEIIWKRRELIKQGKLNWRYREKVAGC